MLGTYAAALLVVGASVPVGAAVLWVSGRREWSWLAPALGLAVLTVAAWILVRLPGEGIAALIGIAVVGIGCSLALPRVGFGREQLVEGGVTAALGLLAVSIPFAVEGHFGILGTGFNVDMSQHLFAAAWIADPLASAPELIRQGYPVGPHSLAVAGGEISANLVYGFTGVTIAVPVIGALTALTATRSLGPKRGIVAALLVGLPYLVASYLAQGAFKELFMAVFFIAFAIWVWEEGKRSGPRGLTFAVPGAVIVAGALYSYSGPSLAWIVGMLGVWGVLQVLRSPGGSWQWFRASLSSLALAALVLVLLVAPEVSRVLEFGGSAGNVANSRDAEPGAGLPPRPLLAQGGASDAEAEPEPERALDLFNNDLGNLFGDIPAAEMFGVWPTGDFRVEPGDGGIPAPVFYLGALLGAIALGIGLRRAVRERDDALIAALIAALVIWVTALAASTPYTTAKALQMVAPALMLLAVRGALDGRFAPVWPRPNLGTAIGVAFALAAAGSSVLALANAPVGPERYTAGIAKLRPFLTDVPVLMLAPEGQLADRHGGEFYGWELRGGSPICVEAYPEETGGFDQPTPAGIRYVLTIGGKDVAPFTDMEEVERRNRVALWEAPDFDAAKAPDVVIDPDAPTNCDLMGSGTL
jgi:hypothetical protein